MNSATIENDHGLFVRPHGEQKQCLGYLLNGQEHGIYEPTLGKVDISPEAADEHNRLLSQGELLGLDQNCAVGQWGTFYVKRSSGKVNRVITWIGELVSDDVTHTYSTVTFRRKGKTFRGHLKRGDDCFNFERIA